MIEATISTTPSRGDGNHSKGHESINTAVPLNFTQSLSPPPEVSKVDLTFNFLLTKLETLCRVTDLVHR